MAIRRLELDSGEITTVRADAHVANGMALDAAGCLIVCEQHPAAITGFDPRSGGVVILVDSYDGEPLNSPTATRELLRFHEWCSVAFTELVTIMPNNSTTCTSSRSPRARWTFLCDEACRGADELDRGPHLCA